MAQSNNLEKLLEEQKKLRTEAGQIIDEICGNCDLIIENRKKLGNKGAYNYCCRECPVAKRLQVIGEKLLETKRKPKKL